MPKNLRSRPSQLVFRQSLVLVPRETTEEEACDAALELLYLYMYNLDEPAKVHKFDYGYGPEDIAALTNDDPTQHMCHAGEILGTLADLEVEALLTPDGTWYEVEPGQLWDDEAWLHRLREVLEQHRDCLAL